VYTGVALGHSVAMVLFGGLMPTVATALYDASWAPPWAPFAAVSAVSALSMLAHGTRLSALSHARRAAREELDAIKRAALAEGVVDSLEDSHSSAFAGLGDYSSEISSASSSSLDRSSRSDAGSLDALLGKNKSRTHATQYMGY